MRQAVPFYANTPDNTHCVQASVRMILKYFLPNRSFSWEMLDNLSAKRFDEPTWPQTMLLELTAMNFDVKLIEGFNAAAFVQDGAEYLRKEFGGETAEWQISHSDIPAEQASYTKLLARGDIYEHRSPTTDDIKNLLLEGYLVTVIVNSHKMDGLSGYDGHSVVVYDIDDTYVTFHDPGLKPREARQETLDHFVSAWADPNDQAKTLIAIKYRG